MIRDPGRDSSHLDKRVQQPILEAGEPVLEDLDYFFALKGARLPSR